MKLKVATALAWALLIAIFIACGGGGVSTAPTSTTVTSSPPPTSPDKPSDPASSSVTTSDSPNQNQSHSRDGEVITAQEFASIDMGMSYNEVVGIVGSYGEEISRTAIGDYETVMFQWANTGFLVVSNANVTFQNGRAIAKAQLGLPNRPGSEQREEGEVERPLSHEEKAEALRAEQAAELAAERERERERKMTEIKAEAETARSAFREFQSANGGFKVRARFAGMDGAETVLLRREDNDKLIKVGLANLSDADRTWINERRNRNGK